MNIMITGGTGTFGKEALRQLLKNQPDKIVIYSRDEFKQYLLAEQYPAQKYPVHFVIGDIRDKERLWRAMDGVDHVIHAAALKQVPACEENPMEAVKTNILGAQNLIECAIDRKVRKVIALGTDKQVNPINLYGATKLCAEKLFMAADWRVTKFSVVRYGNVMASRGSVVPYFRELAAQRKVIPITDNRMTRFWITVKEAAGFVLSRLNDMQGGEIFIPKLPSLEIFDLAQAIYGPKGKYEEVGIRPGEKLHEVLVSRDELRITTDHGAYYTIHPWVSGRPVKREYTSNGQTLLTIPQIRQLLRKADAEGQA